MGCSPGGFDPQPSEQWRSMGAGWWFVPSIMDVRDTVGFVSIPILHGEASPMSFHTLLPSRKVAFILPS